MWKMKVFETTYRSRGSGKQRGYCKVLFQVPTEQWANVIVKTAQFQVKQAVYNTYNSEVIHTRALYGFNTF